MKGWKKVLYRIADTFQQMHSIYTTILFTLVIFLTIPYKGGNSHTSWTVPVFWLSLCLLSMSVSSLVLTILNSPKRYTARKRVAIIVLDAIFAVIAFALVIYLKAWFYLIILPLPTFNVIAYSLTFGYKPTEEVI